MKEERVIAWHFLPSDGKVKRLDLKPQVGRILRHTGPMKICDSGLHGSIRAIDALQYAPGAIITKVEIWGDLQTQSDKICGRNRKLLKIADATRELHEFALWVAEDILNKEKALGRNPDERSLESFRS